VGGYLDVDALAAVGLGGDRSLVCGPRGRAGDALGRAQKRHQRRQVVRPHVEQRAAAAAVEEGGLGVPVLVAGGGPRRRRADRAADPAVVERRAGSLQARPQERVRRSADAQALALGGREDAPGLVGGDRERLLRVNVPALLQRPLDDGRVGGRRREVHDGLDVALGVQRPRIVGLDAVLCGLLAGALDLDVGTRGDVVALEAVVGTQIGVADRSAADDPDVDRIHGCRWETRD
jgi:hypothetical protein